MKWYPTTKISFSDGEVLVKIPLKKKKFKTDFDSFKNVLNNLSDETTKQKLVSQGLMVNKDLDSLILSGIGHWKDRKWTPSLDLYLFSRNINYIDKDDTTGDVRKKIIKSKYGTPKFVKSEHNFIKTINLVENNLNSIDDFYQMILKRKSVRSYDKNKTLHFKDFSSFLIDASKKIKKTRELLIKEDNMLRSYASAFSFYLTIFNVENLEPGEYLFDVEKSTISLIKTGNYSSTLSDFLGEQPFAETANFTMFIVANFQTYQWRYRHERALRNLYIETGRVLEHFSIAGLKVGIQGVVTPALADRKLGKFLGLNIQEELPICSYTFGFEKNV